MTSDEVWDAEAAASCDTPGTGMSDPKLLEATSRYSRPGGAGRALEFAVGTGRVAIPLSERAVSVVGIDSSGQTLAEINSRGTR